jgi:hypothetical protein
MRKSLDRNEEVMQTNLSYVLPLFLAAGLVTQAPAQATSARAKGPINYPWTYRDHVNYVVLVIAERAVPVRAYAIATGPERCDTSGSTLPDSVFRQRAGDFWRGIGYSHYVPGQTFSAGLGEEFVAVSTNAGDFHSSLIFHREGALLLGTTSVWMGTGTQLWPPEPLPASAYSVAGVAPSFRKVFPEAVSVDNLIRRIRTWRFMTDLARRGPYDLTVTWWAPRMDLLPSGGLQVVLVSSHAKRPPCP